MWQTAVSFTAIRVTFRKDLQTLFEPLSPPLAAT